MVVFLGLLNLIARQTADPGARRFCQATDRLGLAFSVLSVLAFPERSDITPVRSRSSLQAAGSLKLRRVGGHTSDSHTPATAYAFASPAPHSP